MSDVERAQAELDDWDATHQVQPTDPGLQSMRFHQTQARRDKDLRSYLNGLRRESEARDRLVENLRKAKRAARDAKLAALTPVDPATLRGARMVQVRRPYGTEWHRVIRVNAKTVTCWAPPGMDQPRYRHADIVDVKHEAAS